jgi:hypothetical protein
MCVLISLQSKESYRTQSNRSTPNQSLASGIAASEQTQLPFIVFSLSQIFGQRIFKSHEDKDGPG